MKILLGVLGAIVGALAGGFAGAMVGAVLGVAVAMMAKMRPEGGDAEVEGREPLPLTTRVMLLEQQVAALRAEVARLAALLKAGAPIAADAGKPAEAAEPGPAPPVSVTPQRPPAPVTAPAPAPHPQAVARSPLPAPPAPVPVAARAPRPPAPPPPPAVPLKDRLPPFLRDWIFGGNTIVKVGVLLLFLGLAFLLRYAAERVVVPVELRYAGVALLGIGLLGLGWRLRAKRDAAGGTGYGLILQGAGIGVLYLTTLASLKLSALLPPEAAFVFLLGVTVLSALLAVVQDAPWLAYVAVAEGMAAPALVSTGSGNHHVLFSYLLLLDVGVFLIAWFKAWRPLNLVAFVGTFALAGAWAQAHYSDAHYAGVQVYLLLFFGLFSLIGVLFARRALALGTPPPETEPLAQRAAAALAQVGRVDSALVFGAPLVTYGLQYLLVQRWEYGPAWAALGFAMFELLLGGVTLRRGGPRYALLGEAYVIVSVIFGTLAIPLALEGAWTGATWAIEAAGMYWLGQRQQRPYARAFGLLVLAGAAVRTAAALRIDEMPGTPLLVGSALGMALLAAGGLAIAALGQRAARQSSPPAWEGNGQALALGIGAAALAAIAWLLFTPLWAAVGCSALALAAALTPRDRLAPALTAVVGALQALALAGFAGTLHVVHGAAMLGSGWQGLLAALLIGASLLATAVLMLPPELRARLRGVADMDAAAAPWPLGATLGLLAGLAAISVALLFVWPADVAARAWPWLGVAALWLGLRWRNGAFSAAGAGLQLVAGMASLWFGPDLWSTDTHGLTLWAPLSLALAGFVSGDALHQAALRAGAPAWQRPALAQWALVVWALLWWALVLPPEWYRGLRHAMGSEGDWPGWWATALGGWVLLTSVLIAFAARWRDWPVLGRSSWATLPAWAFVAWLAVVALGDAPHGHGGWALWPLALVWHALLLREQARWAGPAALKPVHVGGLWLFVLLAASECQRWLGGAPGESEMATAWSALGWVLVPALVLALLTRPALQRRWPVSAFPATYLVVAGGPIAAYLLLWVWVSNILPGDARPLPFVPLLNPLEIGHALVLFSLLLWFRALPGQGQRQLPRPLLLGGLGATAFVLYTGALLRACHHLAGVPWEGGALFESTLAQATLSVAWAILGVGLMVAGHRRVQRIVWAVGASLLAVVVLKLFFVELADSGGLYRIVSFIVVGLLMLLVGYFAPVPPRQAAGASQEAAT